jgi:hypothetical protein
MIKPVKRRNKLAVKKPIKKTVKKKLYITGLSNKDRWQAETIIQDRKWERLSGGAFSSVYTKDDFPDVVLKLTRKDRGYEHYVKLVESNKSVKYFPRIHRIIKIKGGKGYIIEKLSNSKRTTNVVDACRSYFWDKENPPKLLLKYPGLVGAIDKMRRVANKSNLNLDMHNGNLRWRGDVPVIIDPFVG